MLTTLNSIFLVLGMIIGVISIAFVFIYVLEASRGISVEEYPVYKKQSAIMFYLSLAILFIVWLSIPEQMENVVKVMTLFLVLWMLVAIVALILSIALKSSVIAKKNIRVTVKDFIYKAVILFAVLWLIA